ncbi:hypothetical protein RRG08_046552 [Elysia crispata]|uniref:Uncharacterized protein n=1 Tax=Elysia crispata TaxID=231223 RepID=A0AAE0Z7B7_9GAST|nr:hypothetical protein RRG08_046552 [Elysia crispata]
MNGADMSGRLINNNNSVRHSRERQQACLTTSCRGAGKLRKRVLTPSFLAVLAASRQSEPITFDKDQNEGCWQPFQALQISYISPRHLMAFPREMF